MSHDSSREPLIWATKQAIFALDADTGTLRWRRNVSLARRLFRLGARLFVLTGDGIISIAVSSGQLHGAVALDFVPTAGLATAEHLFVSGPQGAAALGPTGVVLWSIARESAREGSARQFFACQGPDGFQLWREEVGEAGSPGLVFGDQITQPS